MRVPEHAPVWGSASALLALGTLVSAILATIALEAFVRRPVTGGGSLTTLMPGYAYATATVMKVCLLAGLLSAVMALAGKLRALVQGTASPAPAGPRWPAWGMASITMAPATPLVGTLVVLIVQTIASTPAQLSIDEFSQFSRTAVFAMLLLIVCGAAAAVTSLVRRERPRLLAVLSLIANALLVALFWYLEFYALGFDQDTWAPR